MGGRFLEAREKRGEYMYVYPHPHPHTPTPTPTHPHPHPHTHAHTHTPAPTPHHTPHSYRHMPGVTYIWPDAAGTCLIKPHFPSWATWGEIIHLFFVSARPGSARLGSAWPGPARLGSARLCSATGPTRYQKDPKMAPSRAVYKLM